MVLLYFTEIGENTSNFRGGVCLCKPLLLRCPEITIDHTSGKEGCPRSRAGWHLRKQGDAHTWLWHFRVFWLQNDSPQALSSAWVYSTCVSVVGWGLSFHFLPLCIRDKRTKVSAVFMVFSLLQGMQAVTTVLGKLQNQCQLSAMPPFRLFTVFLSASCRVQKAQQHWERRSERSEAPMALRWVPERPCPGDFSHDATLRPGRSCSWEHRESFSSDGPKQTPPERPDPGSFQHR